MANLIENIESMGAPTGSVGRVVAWYSENHRERDLAHYNSMFEQICEQTAPPLTNEGFAGLNEARIRVGYLLALSVEKARPDPRNGETDELIKEACQKAVALLIAQPEINAEKEEEPKLDSDGKPKQKKGAKQERAAEVYQRLVAEGADRKAIIQAFMDEVDMSKAGATTYFYNMRRKFS